jgi:hypothetical protein
MDSRLRMDKYGPKLVAEFNSDFNTRLIWGVVVNKIESNKVISV